MAKEKLFESPKTQTLPITLLGKGTKLVGGTIKTELAREDLNQILVEGFFPKVASDELPARQRRVGFQELGLPYAADPAITKHLARFLSEQVRNSPEAAGIRRGGSGLACPTHILFNGGVLKAAVLRDRVVEVLNSWLRQEGFETLGKEQILEAPDLEHVATVPRAHITSELKAPCQQCPAWKLHSRRSVSFPLEWRRARKPRYPIESLDWWSANQPSFVS